MTYAVTNLGIGAETRRFFYRNNSTDAAVINQVLIERHYDSNRLGRSGELRDYLERTTSHSRKPLIIDAGANIGASTLYFLGDVPKACVIAIEPDLENFKLLRKNVEGLNVEPIRGAVSSTRGSHQVIDPGEGQWGYRTARISNTDTANQVVECVTVNDLYAAHRDGFFPFIVKVDIEGGESDLFSGNTEWVGSTPLIIVELHDWLLPKQGTSRTLLKCMADQDRDFIYIGQNVFSISNHL
jgi:FkbM family methyltransferase